MRPRRFPSVAFFLSCFIPSLVACGAADPQSAPAPGASSGDDRAAGNALSGGANEVSEAHADPISIPRGGYSLPGENPPAEHRSNRRRYHLGGTAAARPPVAILGAAMRDDGSADAFIDFDVQDTHAGLLPPPSGPRVGAVVLRATH